MTVPFLDLPGQHARIRPELDAALAAVVDQAGFIGGAAVRELESAIAAHVMINHAVGTSSCTAALAAVLRSLELSPDDEVIVPALTAVPTAEAVKLAGARIVFADIGSGGVQVDPASVAAVMTTRTRAMVVVHLHGLVAPIEELAAIARARGVFLIEDVAQAFGARFGGAPLGGFGWAGCLSFFPSKPLGGFGDGGMVVTDDETTARFVRMYVNHGRTDKFRHDCDGANERLDALQAAVLRVKLRYLDDWNARRRQVADWYEAELEGIDELVRPVPIARSEPVWHVYGVRCRRRDELRAMLAARKIGTGLHYPLALPQQPVFAREAAAGERCRAAERAAAELLSLPMDPFMTRAQVAEVGHCLRDALVRPTARRVSLG